MKFGALLVAIGIAVSANAQFVVTNGGLTVYDRTLGVTWLANANFPGTAEGRLGVAKVMPNGSMDYQTALQWVAALNTLNYLGHNNWQLPATPTIDSTCAATGPNGNSFGFGCLNSALGSLFYRELNLQYPNTAVPIPNEATGPFNNFQPYLYWSDTAGSDSSQGYYTFSFATGWHGANVDKHYIYALPMIKGRLPGSPAPSGTALQASADGQTVYDPMADVTWLANADLAKTQTFEVQCTNKDGTACINPDGSMTHTTAENWIAAMNAAHYLGQTNWQLPPMPEADPTCGGNAGFNCTGSPMGILFYKQLKLAQGVSVVAVPNIRVGPFNNIQPYLYWTCTAAPGSQVLCNSDLPAPNFGWSFSFGNGFQGTDLQHNGLFVTVYYPSPPAPPHRRAARH